MEVLATIIRVTASIQLIAFAINIALVINIAYSYSICPGAEADLSSNL